MTKNGNYQLSDKDRKTVILSIRCTPDDARRIKEKAKQKEVSTSEYMMDCFEKQMKRRTSLEKCKARAMVEMQENMNQIISGLTIDQQELKEYLIQMEEEAMVLWHN